MRANVKPLTYWLIHNGYTVRFGRRSPESVRGVITTPDGELDFDYVPDAMIISLPDRTVAINQFGWEIDRGRAGNEVTGQDESTGKHDD